MQARKHFHIFTISMALTRVASAASMTARSAEEGDDPRHICLICQDPDALHDPVRTCTIPIQHKIHLQKNGMPPAHAYSLCSGVHCRWLNWQRPKCRNISKHVPETT